MNRNDHKLNIILGKDWYGVINYKTLYFISIPYVKPWGKKIENYPLKTFMTTKLKRNPSNVIKNKTFTGLVAASIECSVMRSPPVCWISHFAYMSWYFPKKPGDHQVNAFPIPCMESLLTSALENVRCIPKSHLHFFSQDVIKKPTVLFECPCVDSLLKYS